jgi:hypothetical protein
MSGLYLLSRLAIVPWRSYFAESFAPRTFGATWLASLLEPRAVADFFREVAELSFILESVDAHMWSNIFSSPTR